MRSLLPLILYCISLVSLQQLLTLAHEESPSGNRLELLDKLVKTGDESLDSGRHPEAALPSSATRPAPRRLAAYLRHPPGLRVRKLSPNLAWARPAQASQIDQKARRVTSPSLAWALPSGAPRGEQGSPRVRRHAVARGGHHHSPKVQLMRVGCALGTCQVQNLSHRLYQLIGQSGREEFAPINPESPHSYG